MGLDHFDLRFHVTKDGMQKGFHARTDSYLWGILSYRCAPDGTITAEACNNLSAINDLTGTMYVLLSFASLALAATMGMLVLSSSPVVNFKSTTALYAASALLTLIPLLIFELKAGGILGQPIDWAIWDKQIHSTFAGVDAVKHVPLQSRYEPQRGISRIMVWVAFGCIFGSMCCFLVRLYRARRSKKYLTSFNTLFKSRPSLFVSVAEGTLTGARSRRASTQDSL
jgi:hypothetical protein